MGVMLSAGGSLAWWRETPGRDYDELVGAAEEVPPGSEGLLFLPYLTGERTPHLDPSARGAFVGLMSHHTLAHMTRAVMEGMTFSLRDSLEIMRELEVPVEHVRAVGGGARSSLWRRLQADVYYASTLRTTADEGPAYGAALLGGVAAGVYRDAGEACAQVELREEVTLPQQKSVASYNRYYEVYRSLYEANKDAMHRLSRVAADG